MPETHLIISSWWSVHAYEGPQFLLNQCFALFGVRCSPQIRVLRLPSRSSSTYEISRGTPNWYIRTEQNPVTEVWMSEKFHLDITWVTSYLTQYIHVQNLKSKASTYLPRSWYFLPFLLPENIWRCIPQKNVTCKDPIKHFLQ